MPGTRCAVGICSNSLQKTKINPDTAHIKYHRFPKDKHLRKLWVHRCKRNVNFNPSAAKVCSVHFKDDDFERDLQNELLGLAQKKVLKKDAVPSLHMTNSSDHEGKKKAAQNRISLSAKIERKRIVESLLKSYARRSRCGRPGISTSVKTDAANECGKSHEKIELVNFDGLNSGITQNKCLHLQTKLNDSNPRNISGSPETLTSDVKGNSGNECGTRHEKIELNFDRLNSKFLQTRCLHLQTKLSDSSTRPICDNPEPLTSDVKDDAGTKCGMSHEIIEQQLNFERLNSKILKNKCLHLQTKLNVARREIRNLKLQ
ncbi:uncharacterized protein LOC134541925 isoform X2 [Bacillus rossius redtenbacheri]